MDFIGDRKIFALAPMAGFTNSACRSIFMEYGADVSVSEFVYSKAVLYGAGRVFEKISFESKCRPIGIQIFGSDPVEMAEAATVIEERLSPDFIDVNFGCPAPNAVNAGAGSALLKNVKLMRAIVAKMSDSVKIPITAKMRIGWERSDIVVPRAAQELEQAGAKMISLHGRTKTQGYEGEADWVLIEQTASALSIPLLGNGSAEKLSGDFMCSSGCAGFMIGRAALGNPWIFAKLRSRLEGRSEDEFEPTPRERARLALRYARAMTNGDYEGISAENIKFIKTQVMRFLKTAEGFKRLRVQLRDINTIDELETLLCDYI